MFFWQFGIKPKRQGRQMGVNKNANLGAARATKDDEFYTRLVDIENELKNYKSHFVNKVIYCNCDDPDWSNFYKYFSINFTHLQLKRLITTHYTKDASTDPAYKKECFLDAQGNVVETKTLLQGDGDFRSEECIALLKQSDIVCTNPPFSLFREYVAQLMVHKKDFLIIGSQNAITYKETFELIRANSIWLGVSHPKEFLTPTNDSKKFGNICWFTNLIHNKRNEKLFLWKSYSNSMYQKYDNYDAIEVGKVADIPVDYLDVMGVPITFLEKYNPEQFTVVGLAAGNIKGMAGIPSKTGKDGPYIDGKLKYGRIIIKAKAPI